MLLYGGSVGRLLINLTFKVGDYWENIMELGRDDMCTFDCIVLRF